MYKGEADWEYISKIKQNPEYWNSDFGNGDIDSPEKALEQQKKICFVTNDDW